MHGPPRPGPRKVSGRLRKKRISAARSLSLVSPKETELEFRHGERAPSLVIPTEPSASGRRGISAERFAWTVEKKESLRIDPSAAPQYDGFTSGAECQALPGPQSLFSAPCQGIDWKSSLFGGSGSVVAARTSGLETGATSVCASAARCAGWWIGESARSTFRVFRCAFPAFPRNSTCRRLISASIIARF